MFSQAHARGNAHANAVPIAKRSDAPALHKGTEAVRNVAERPLQPLQLPVPPSATFDELRASGVLARPVRATTLFAGGAGKHHRRKRPVDSGSRPPNREDRERARGSASLELETRLRGGRRRARHARGRLAHRLSPFWREARSPLWEIPQFYPQFRGKIRNVVKDSFFKKWSVCWKC